MVCLRLLISMVLITFMAFDMQIARAEQAEVSCACPTGEVGTLVGKTTPNTWVKVKDAASGAVQVVKDNKGKLVLAALNPSAAIALVMSQMATRAVSSAGALAIKFGLTGYRKQVAEQMDPLHCTLVATAVRSSELNDREKAYVQERRASVRRAQAQFLGDPTLTDEDTLIMAACGSGGGMRACFATLGSLVGAEAVGLSQTFMYAVGLSGSTWALCPLTFFRHWSGSHISQDVIDKADQGYIKYFREVLVERAGIQTTTPFASGNRLNIQISYPPRSQIINDVIWPRAVFAQPASSVGIYGALLANALLWFMGEKRQRQVVSEQEKIIQMYRLWIPIYTAIAPYMDSDLKEGKTEYTWYEFTPYEVRDLTYEVSVPVWSFGRRFEEGRSTDEAPEQSAGFLAMAIPGSAYTVSVEDILAMVKSDDTPQAKMTSAPHTQTLVADPVAQASQDPEAPQPKTFGMLDALKQKVTIAFLELLAKTDAGTVRLSPATLFNPAYHLDNVQGTKLYDERTVNLLDAGISKMNLPVPPLLKPERGVNVIFLFDASASDKRVQLREIREYAQKYNLKCPQILDDDIEKSTTQPVTFFEDPLDLSVPLLVYIPLMKNPDYASSFDPVTAPWCNTFNFNYSPENVTQLTGLTKFTMEQITPQIKNVLRDRIARMRKKRKESVGVMHKVATFLSDKPGAPAGKVVAADQHARPVAAAA